MPPIPSEKELDAARRVPVWKDFVPRWIRFPLIVVMNVIFMFSGGVYMSGVAEITGETALQQEDVMMAGYACLTGLTMAFPVLFRIMFRFNVCSILLVSIAFFVVSDYVCMVSQFVPLIVFLSFVSGFFKILSTFVCWNCVQLIITPERDFAVFFPFLFSFVLGSVQLVNLATGYSIYYFDWQAMHRITILAFLCVGIIVAFCMRRYYRNGLYIPFKGIDYLGGVLWTLLLFCIVFVFVYGDYYDWLDASEIQTAVLFAAILLFMCLHRAGRIRHPFISHETFSQRNMLFIFLLFGGMTLMSATNTSTQNIFTGRILGFDSRYQADLNWGLTAGIVVGTVFFFLAIKQWKWRVKMVVLCGFLFFLAYQAMMYFLIDASTESYMLQLPSLCKGAGVGLVYTSLTFALAGSTTFEYYFQAMCVIGFIRTSFGTPLSSAIFGRAYKRMFGENAARLGWELDGTALSQLNMPDIAAEFQRQVTMVTIKEVYGLAAIVAIVIILLILASDFRHPVIKSSNHLLKKSQAWLLTKRSMAKSH